MAPTRADASRGAPSPKRGLHAACVSLFCCAALQTKWCCGASQSKEDAFVAAAERPMRAPGAWASCRLLRHPEPRTARRALPEAVTAASAAVFVAAAVFARVQEEGSGGKKLLKEAGPFRFYVDRCLINFDQAFCQLAATESSLPAMIPVFTFFDGYFPVPELDTIPSKVLLLDRSVTDTYDDKRRLAVCLREACCEATFARCYLTDEEVASAASGGKEGQLFFVKPPCESGGRGIRVVDTSQLRQVALEEGSLVQEAVQDLETLDQRKFVLRFYLLIHGGRLYLHKRGVVVVHEKPYDPASTDYDVQVCHDEMHSAGAADRLRPWHLQPEAERWRSAVRQCLTEALPALWPLLEASSLDRYALVGGDALIERSGDAKLIEFNFFPNLGSRNGALNSLVKQPMLSQTLPSYVPAVPAACKLTERVKEVNCCVLVHTHSINCEVFGCWDNP
ncbi:unnamed protein product [Symbiodinium sp. CCMP2592]|nr:unnamed protein product [Symbiodinium sp. CCMP2592]